MKKTIFIIFTCINIIIAIILLIKPIKHYVTTSNYAGVEVFPAAIIEEGNDYSQDIVCTLDYTESVSIKLSTYEVENKEGTMVFSLYNKRLKKQYEDLVELSNLKDNEYYYFLQKDICKKGDIITLNFSYDNYKDGNSLTYWYRIKDVDKSLRINNIDVGQEINLQMKGYSYDRSYIWYPLMLMMMGSVYYCIRKEEK